MSALNVAAPAGAWQRFRPFASMSLTVAVLAVAAAFVLAPRDTFRTPVARLESSPAFVAPGGGWLEPGLVVFYLVSTEQMRDLILAHERDLAIQRQHLGESRQRYVSVLLVRSPHEEADAYRLISSAAAELTEVGIGVHTSDLRGW